MSRYLEAEPNLKRRMNKLVKVSFPFLKKAEIKILLDTKKKKSKGKIRIAEIKVTDDLNRFFTKEQSDNLKGYDYIMFIDAKLPENVENKDMDRIIFHELNHPEVNKKGQFKLKPHDFEGFYSEIDFNKDDPQWAERIAAVLEELHDLDEEEEE